MGVLRKPAIFAGRAQRPQVFMLISHVQQVACIEHVFPKCLSLMRLSFLAIWARISMALCGFVDLGVTHRPHSSPWI